MGTVRRTLLALAVAAGAVVAFLPYNEGRAAFSEQFGLSVTSVVVGLLFSSVIPSFVAFPIALVKLARHEHAPWFPWTLMWTFLLGSLAGCAVAEVGLLVDEARFVRGVDRAPAEPHHSARAWPNENCSMLYSPERGYWSND